MKPQSRDTPLEIEAILIEGYRAMTPAQKLERVSQMTRAVQELALARIRAQHPDEGEREHRLRLASLWLPAELMRRAFDWDVDQRGY